MNSQIFFRYENKPQIVDNLQDALSKREQHMVAILSADIEGYTRMMQEDEEAGSRILQKFKAEITQQIKEYQGQVVNFYGDGALCVFDLPSQAADFALIIQSAYQRAPKIPVRIGIHSGRVTFEDKNVYGDSVNLAYRIEAVGIPGSILLSTNVKEAIQDTGRFPIKELGDFSFKNVLEPTKVFALTNAGLNVPAKQTIQEKNQSTQPQKTVSNRPASIVLPILALAVIGLLGLFFYKNTPTTNKETALGVVSSVPINSIAVIPFTNMSTSIENQYFADGMHDDLLTYLSKSDDLKVISRTSVTAFKETTKSIKEIAGLLGVAHILEGSVRRVGDQVRINVQLIEAATDDHLWAEIYDITVTPENIFNIQSKITQEISKNLTATISKNSSIPQPKQYTDNLVAYENYLRARQLKETGNKASLFEAKQLLEEAIQLDDQFALAHILLGNLHIHLIYYAGADSEEYYTKAWTLMEKGMELDEESVEAYTLKGSLYHWWKRDIKGASAAYEKAIRLNPNYDKAYYGYNIAIHDLKRNDAKEFELIQKALSINPLSPQLINSNGIALRERGQIDEAISNYRKGVRIAPTHPLLWSNYSGTYYYKNQIDSVAIINHQCVRLNGKTGLYLDYYLEGLNDLSLLPELEKELNHITADTEQEQKLKLNYQRQLALRKKDYTALVTINEQWKQYETNKASISKYDFEAAYQQRDFKKAAALYETINHRFDLEDIPNIGNQSNFINLQSYIHCLQQLQQTEKAQKLLQQYADKALLKAPGQYENVVETQLRMYLKSRYLQLMGQSEKAMNTVEEFFRSGSFYRFYWVALDPLFDDLRTQDPYVNLMDTYRKQIQEQQNNYRTYLGQL